MPEPILDLFALFGPIPPRTAEMGTEGLKAAHAATGVAGALALSTRGIHHSAAAGNRETQKLCGESGGRLLPVGVLDPRVPELGSLPTGVKAIAAFPSLQGWPIRYAAFERSLRQIAESGAGLPLLCDVSRPGDATALGELVQKTKVMSPVLLLGVGSDDLAEAVAVMSEMPQLMLGTECLLGIGEVALAVSLVGPARVAFASGCVARRSLRASVAVVQGAELSDADRTAVLSGNARRFLSGGAAG